VNRNRVRTSRYAKLCGAARVTSGLALTLRNNATISLGGELGGLGAGYEIWSANAKVTWPF